MDTEKINDNRMAWIRNIEDIQTRGFTDYSYEYEILSEARITGVLSYEDGAIRCGIMQSNDGSGLNRYLIKLQLSPIGDPPYNKNANEEGYFFPEGIIGELIVLLGLFYQSRFYIDATYIGELNDDGLRIRTQNSFHHAKQNNSFPKIFQRGAQNFLDFHKFLDSIRTLQTDKHHQVVLSAYLYSLALKHIGMDLQMIFIHLVSATETLSKEYVLSHNQNPLCGRKLSDFIKPEIGMDDQSAIRDLLDIKNGCLYPKKSSKRFIEFLNHYSKGYFTGGHWKAKHLHITKDQAPKYWRRIYNARSKYLHEGAQMFTSQDFGTNCNWDIDPALGMIIDNRYFPDKEKLPSADWFQDIVRHCLLKYIEAYCKND